MIVFASCVGHPDKWKNIAKPGILRSMGEEEHFRLPMPSNGKDIFPVYGSCMRMAREVKDLEALVLMHDDLEIKDGMFAKVVRDTLDDPDVAIIGCIGAQNVTSPAWWNGLPKRGYVQDDKSGMYDWGFGHPDANVAEVHCIDGMMIILSPWAVKLLCLEGLGYSGFHGYTEELCAQTRACGKKVVVAKFVDDHGGPGIHHHSKGGIVGGDEGWIAATENFQRRWPCGC